MNKQTIIIFEGHDKSGKTAISQELSKRLNIPIFKYQRSKYFWDPLCYQTYAQEAITQLFEQTQTSVILDRAFPSDYLYSQLFKRSYDYERHWMTDLRFAAMNALIVYCYKDEASYIEDLEDKDFIKIEDYNKMKAIYGNYLDKTKCRYIKINTSDEDLEKQLEKIIKNI